MKLLRECFAAADAAAIKKAAFYCFYASRNHIEFETAMQEAGWRVKQQLIWTKQMVLGRSDYHWSHEPFLYATKTGENCEWLGDRTETTVLDTEWPDLAKMTKDQLLAILRQIRETSTIWQEKRDSTILLIHPTQKPTGLCRRALRNSSLPGEICLDLFGGSGSTLIACELEGRQARLVELDGGYCDVILQRYAETFENTHFTKNGKPFSV